MSIIISSGGKYESQVRNIQAYDTFRKNARNISLQLLGGNVGIGMTTPSEKLDVSGNIKCTGKVEIGGKIIRDENSMMTYVDEFNCNSGQDIATNSAVTNGSTVYGNLRFIDWTSTAAAAATAAGEREISARQIMDANMVGGGAFPAAYWESLWNVAKADKTAADSYAATVSALGIQFYTVGTPPYNYIFQNTNDGQIHLRLNIELAIAETISSEDATSHYFSCYVRTAVDASLNVFHETTVAQATSRQYFVGGVNYITNAMVRFGGNIDLYLNKNEGFTIIVEKIYDLDTTDLEIFLDDSESKLQIEIIH